MRNKSLRKLCIAALLLWSNNVIADGGFECGQNAAVPRRVTLQSQAKIATEPLIIDYAIFYTPEAREMQGGTDAMVQRINTAFAGANEIFINSGSPITHRVVHIEELPLNNTSTTLPELGSELFAGFNFFEALDRVEADSSVIIVKSQSPGGFANIPLSRSQALRGGSINLGLPNVSGGVLAHEIGHTLGSGHDYVELSSRFFDLPPEYGYGNHFIGTTNDTCYRTIMSARITCRVAGYESQPAILANVFSSSTLLFDGTLTGHPTKADNVRIFAHYGPLVASARGASQLPAPEPTATPLPDSGGGGGDDDDGEDDETEPGDTLTFQIRKNRNGRFSGQGRCLSAANTPLTGDAIEIVLVNQQTKAETRQKRVRCNRTASFSAQLTKKGRYRARNTRTRTESAVVRLR